MDGAHRLSAIIAYINDDYGDRDISHKFYGHNNIPQEEIDLANETREYINKTIGSFGDTMANGGARADGLRTNTFKLQKITGALKIAENSFFKINQQGVVLSPTEKALCKYRDKPSSIATRSIMKGEGGGQYWNTFSKENKNQAKIISTKINTILFKPPYSENAASVILHHPLGGSITNAMPMVYDLVKSLQLHQKKAEPEQDKKGDVTIEYLKYTEKMINRLLSDHPSSLGLFPSVYFYNNNGKYIQSAFLGMVELLLEKQSNKNFIPTFITVRGRLETFLINHKIFLTQINRKYGSKSKSYRHMKGFYNNLIEIFKADVNIKDSAVIKKLKASYDFLNENESEIEGQKKRKFSAEQRVIYGTKEELKVYVKCKICNGLIHPLSKSADHRKDLKYGGGSEESNHNTTHKYCNHSKDLLIKFGIYPTK